jgi:hypothetical protein
VVRHIFQACPVWILRVTSQASYHAYYFDIISIVWKYTIIMDNQNPFYFQRRSIQFPYNFHSMTFYGFSIFFPVSSTSLTILYPCLVTCLSKKFGESKFLKANKTQNE